MSIAPPLTRQELIRRAESIAGLTIQQLANMMGKSVPQSSTHAKGWFGNLLELSLGANAASAPEPRFYEFRNRIKINPYW